MGDMPFVVMLQPRLKCWVEDKQQLKKKKKKNRPYIFKRIVRKHNHTVQPTVLTTDAARFCRDRECEYFLFVC